MFAYLKTQSPIFSAAHSPAYSNIAYGLLGFAQESITGTPVQTAIEEGIFEALGMKQSSFKTPQTIKGGVIPGGEPSKVGWGWDMGPSNPSGSIYSSTADLVKACQAILQSSLISPDQTRRWLKPHMQTSYLGAAVGAPWEIRYLSLPNNNRLTQLYSKQGDTGTYHAALVLSPEHDLGWVVLTAGTPEGDNPTIREDLLNAFGDMFLPAAEEQAQKEAEEAYAGTYVDKATNSTAKISVNDRRPGLTTTSLISRGVPIIGPDSALKEQFGAGGFAKLYPSGLRTVSASGGGEGTYESRVGFRATFFNQTEEDKVQDPCLMSWTALGAPSYGQVTLDNWVFDMGEDHKAKALTVKMLRLKLEKEEA